MPLSDHEQRLLSQMEEQLVSDDPRFASTMRGSAKSARSGKRLVVGIGGVVVGLGLLLLSVAVQEPLLGVLAFAIMLAAAAYALAGPRKGKGGLNVVDSNGQQRPPRRSPKSSFVERMETRWDDRRHRGDSF